MADWRWFLTVTIPSSLDQEPRGVPPERAWGLYTTLPSLDQSPEAVPAEWSAAYWGPPLLAYNVEQSGAPPITGTAALTGTVGALAATGEEVFGGTAALAGSSGSLVASGAEEFSGAVALSGASGSVAALGEEVFSAGAGLNAAPGEMGAFGTVGDPLPEPITGTADMVGTPGEITAIGEYTPLAITGTAELTGTPGELSATDAEEQPESPSMGGGYVLMRKSARPGVTVVEEVDATVSAPVADVALALTLTEETTEALTSGPTAELTPGEAEALVPEPAGSADIGAEIIADSPPVAEEPTYEILTPEEATTGVVAEIEAAAPALLPDESVSEIVPITPEAVDAILATEPLDDEAGLVLAIVMALDEAGV
jgi:hypothetical protein